MKEKAIALITNFDDQMFLPQFKYLLLLANNTLLCLPHKHSEAMCTSVAYSYLRRTTWHICYAWYQITEILMSVMSNKKKELGVLQIVLDIYIPNIAIHCHAVWKKKGLWNLYL